MSDKIEIGDRVDILFQSTPWILDAEVLYIPSATGDSWRVKTKEGLLIYVQQFNQMTKRSPR